MTDLIISNGPSIVIKATVLLGIAVAAHLLMRRRVSAATRHFVLTLAVAGVLLLPAMSFVAPEWGLAHRVVEARESDSSFRLKAEAIGAQPPIEPGSSWSSIEPGSPWLPPSGGSSTILVLLYISGVALSLLHLLAQRLRTRRFICSTTLVDDPEWQELLVACAAAIGVRRTVRLLRSREHNVPLALGTRRPAIVIPAIADTWTEDRRRAVMLHELAHVVRHDCLTEIVSALACAMYWFHPAAWWVARRLRTERELACDDRVIIAGAEGRDYAGHLLDIAYASGGQRSFALAVSMARRNQLEGRLIAALDDARNRRAPALRACLAVVLLAAVVMFAVAGARASVVNAQDDAAAAVSPAAAVAASASGPEALQSIGPMQNVQDVQDVLNRVASRVVRAAGNVARNLQDGLPGTWEVRPTATQGTVHLRLVEVNSQSGFNVPLAELEGLTAAQLSGSGGAVQFRVRRDAGTFTFEGVFRSGVGAGTFSFAPDPNFPAELAKRGFARPTASEQYQLARHNIGFAFVDELTRQGYTKPPTSELVRAGQHGVQLTYLREMGALGLRFGSLEPLITLRDHGVTPDYVRQLAELGYKGLTADELRNARDHGITPEYVRAMRDGGYGQLPMEALINARDHGVTPDYVQALDEAGYRKLPLDQVIRVRDHGVSPEYIREMQQLGFKLSLDELVRARDHGVTTDYVRAVAALGYGNQPIDALIRLRDHGVTPEYAKEIKALGYDGLTLDDLVSLRDHGVTVERIKAANARAGTRLPIDMLRSLVSGGMR